MNQVLIAEKKAQANIVMRREETTSTQPAEYCKVDGRKCDALEAEGNEIYVERSQTRSATSV